jgi:acyl carrier protein
VLDDRLEHLEIHIGALTDAAALRRLFMKVRTALGPIRGVVHSAAIYSDATAPGFADKSLDAMQRVLAAKVGGLETLHAVLKSDPLDFFVSLASMTGVMPRLARGAADYAMANAFVEAFTAYQDAQDGGAGRYKAIVWSDWNETGGITRVSPERAQAVAETFRGIGLRTFSNAEGRVLFERAMARKTGGTLVVVYVDPETFEAARPRLLLPGRDVSEAARAAPMPPVRDVAHHVAQWEAEARAGGCVAPERITDVIGLDDLRGLDPALIGRIHAVMFGHAKPAAMPPTPARDYRAAITTTVMGVLKLKTVSAEQPLQNYGLDSISATVLATRLERELDLEIRPQWLIEFPTIEALARHIATQAGDAARA